MRTTKLGTQKDKRFYVLLLATFIDTLGIGILNPVLPFLVSQYAQDSSDQAAFYVGLITSLFAFCEFFAAPVLGVLSDKYGRRPVMLVSIAGTIISYLLLGLSSAMWVLFLGRIIAGVTAGNISTVFAYVSDITEPEQRAKRYGAIGGMLGLGFIIGPAVGGFAAQWSLQAPMFIAAALSLINLVWAYFALPETLKEKGLSAFHIKDINPFSWLGTVRTNSILKFLLFASIFHFIAFAQLQGNLPVFFKDALNWGTSEIGLSFLMVGIGDLVTQGLLVGRLKNVVNERQLSIIGLSIASVAYFLLTTLVYSHSSISAYVIYLVFALGKGLFEPSMASLVSQTVTEKEQGKVQGAYQALQSLTRVIGPITAAFLYSITWTTPYFISGLLTLITVVLFVRLRQKRMSS
ncbi:MAG: MFS transporter [Chitinophagaceae bacterium]|nr:MAG: MFS transporter [Chitinophagaceae bacterium]